MDKSNPSGYEVYQWPEFQAFAARLGIDWRAPTTDLCVFIPVNGAVRIVQEYLGDEMFNMRRNRQLNEIAPSPFDESKSEASDG